MDDDHEVVGRRTLFLPGTACKFEHSLVGVGASKSVAIGHSGHSLLLRFRIPHISGAFAVAVTSPDLDSRHADVTLFF
jgi:hypothetical protein